MGTDPITHDHMLRRSLSVIRYTQPCKRSMRAIEQLIWLRTGTSESRPEEKTPAKLREVRRLDGTEPNSCTFSTDADAGAQDLPTRNATPARPSSALAVANKDADADISVSAAGKDRFRRALTAALETGQEAH
eukprot:4190054-Pleurochrysis_carterae.AAC.4